jgi:hypothetical protein
MGKVGAWGVLGLVIGAIISALCIPFAKQRIEVPKSPLEAREILQKFVPEDAKFSDQTSPQPILTAFH